MDRFISGAGSCCDYFARDCGSDYLILRGWPANDDHGARYAQWPLCPSYRSIRIASMSKWGYRHWSPMTSDAFVLMQFADSIERWASSHL